MRGRAGPNRRSRSSARPSNEATARTYAVPSPYNGWNARGNLSVMKPTEAIQLDNLFPGIQSVGLRKGCINWVTGFSANIKSLLPYSGRNIDKLFASTNTGIYDVTGSGVVGAAAATCTNGQWESVNITTAGGSFLVCCNATDPVKTYDGTTWATAAITGVTSSNLAYVTLHQKRMWFTELNTMNLWYLAPDSFQGAATLFPCGTLFKKGGYLVALHSWTFDGGSGSDDYLVIATSNGELAIYRGIDPATSSTWALVGVYDVPKPLGKKPLRSLGGDLLYLSQSGLIPMSTLHLASQGDTEASISFNIDGAFIDSAALYSGLFGWDMTMHKAANLLLVNVPVSADTLSYQYVMNTITKAWCRFTGWNVSCFATLGSDLYFAGGTKVSKGWTGYSDAGIAINALAVQAYASLGMRSQKEITLVRPAIGQSGAASIQMSLDTDYKTFNGQTQFNYTPLNNSAIWDVSLWDTGIWDGGALLSDPRWLTIPCDLGYLHSFRLQISSSSSSLTWTSTNYAYKPAGIL